MEIIDAENHGNAQVLEYVRKMFMVQKVLKELDGVEDLMHAH